MENNLEDISKLVEISKPIIEPIISTLLKPKIAALAKWLKKEETKNKAIDNYFENKFEHYLNFTLNKCQNINILILQNQQIHIKDIYYPLTISDTKTHQQYQIDTKSVTPIFEKYKKLLISDTAGMGKSTLSKWICMNALENTSAIPVLIELRNISESHGILDEIFNQINPLDKSFDEDLILKFLETGNFLIILDGFDEIQLKHQELIIKNIREFINKVPNNWFMLTSRPEGALASFGDFQLFNINPLKDNEAYDLILKYDSLHPIKIGEKLIADIKGRYNHVRDLLGNPFLISLLYSTYTYNKDIPASKSSFYEEIYSALFKKHDLSKDGWSRIKKSKLEFQQFRIILRQLAFDTAIEGTVNYSETELVKWIIEAAQKCPGIEVEADDFLNDLLSSVPLFQQDGLKIKWAHKSLQDFFAAEFISYDSNKEIILHKVYENNINSFHNILDFISEIDFKTFRKTLVKRLLNDFIEHMDSSYPKGNFPDIDPKMLEERKLKTFGTWYIFEKAGDRKFLNDLPFNDDKTRTLTRNKIEYTLRFVSIDISNYSLTYSNIKTNIISILLKGNYKYIDILQDGSTNSLKIKNDITNEVDDNPQNIFNTVECFKNVTNSLIFPDKGNMTKGYPVLNYIESKKELEKIETEIQQEKNFREFDLFKRK